MNNNLLIGMLDNPQIKLEAKNTWLPAYAISFDLKLKTYDDGKNTGEIPAEACNLKVY